MATLAPCLPPSPPDVQGLDEIEWTQALEAALLKLARQTQFDFDKVARAMRAAVTKGLVRPAMCYLLYFRVKMFPLLNFHCPASCFIDRLLLSTNHCGPVEQQGLSSTVRCARSCAHRKISSVCGVF